MKEWRTTVACLLLVLVVVCLNWVGKGLDALGPDRSTPAEAGVGTCFVRVPSSLQDPVEVTDCGQKHRAQKIAELVVPAVAIGSPDIPDIVGDVAAKCPQALAPMARKLLRDGVIRLYDYRPTSGAAHVVCMVAAADGRRDFVTSAI